MKNKKHFEIGTVEWYRWGCEATYEGYAQGGGRDIGNCYNSGCSIHLRRSPYRIKMWTPGHKKGRCSIDGKGTG